MGVWIVLTSGLLVILVVAPRSVLSKPVNFLARVVDANSTEPVYRASILLQVSGGFKEYSTDSLGQFSFSMVPRPEGTTGLFKIDAVGYEHYELNVTLRRDQQSLPDFKLPGHSPATTSSDGLAQQIAQRKAALLAVPAEFTIKYSAFIAAPNCGVVKLLSPQVATQNLAILNWRYPRPYFEFLSKNQEYGYGTYHLRTVI